MKRAYITALLFGVSLASACSEGDTGMAGDNPLKDAREATQPSPPQPETNGPPSEPHGGLSTQPVIIPTNPPEPKEDGH